MQWHGTSGAQPRSDGRPRAVAGAPVWLLEPAAERGRGPGRPVRHGGGRVPRRLVRPPVDGGSVLRRRRAAAGGGHGARRRTDGHPGLRPVGARCDRAPAVTGARRGHPTCARVRRRSHRPRARPADRASRFVGASRGGRRPLALAARDRAARRRAGRTVDRCRRPDEQRRLALRCAR